MYNYPQISSQDYEVYQAATAAFFFSYYRAMNKAKDKMFDRLVVVMRLSLVRCRIRTV